jgi:putative membrane protein
LIKVADRGDLIKPSWIRWGTNTQARDRHVRNTEAMKEPEMMDWNDGSGWMNGNGMWMMLLFWAVFMAVVVWAVLRKTRRGVPAMSAESPRQILDRRFAAGEVDAEQYGEARRVLEGRSVITTGPPSG